ncbi:hypothetical protein [uncultured Clostridium sp.]|jgi:hypothetical protein|uniref:hypothetical protein n=1 Tax=uncultured Clostridium sp. TaxID=59620 RepID=UPI002631FEA7|nr:hypothetical protein [uncultured Clostridium sp.]
MADMEIRKRLRKIYKEVCKETGLTCTVEGWTFFCIDMFEDYMAFCEREGIQPCYNQFKRNAISIAKEMIKEAL